MPTDVLESPVSVPATPVTATARRPRRRLRTIGSYTLLTVGALIILFPIYVTIVNSLLSPDQLVHQPPPLFPTNPQWHDYSAAWNGGQMSQYVTTSAIMTAIIVVGQLVTSVLAAYAFAFRNTIDVGAVPVARAVHLPDVRARPKLRHNR